jgi:probable DNA repair protein
VDFDTHLQVWGLVTNRTLSSTEYQLFNKYQQASSEFNCLAQTRDKINATDAILDLKKWLSQVVFQAQSAKTPIQILGSLEAEGLYFDAAWVLGMTDNFLPMPLNSPRFIPSSIAQQHQIPHSSFALIAKDAQDTLNNLINLSDKVIFSYAKTHFENEQRPSPLLIFNTENSALKHTYQSIVLNTLADAKAKPLKDKQVHGGVGILKNQMACAFSGYAHRLNTLSFDEPHIGLNRLEQGNIIHTTLQYFYQEITSQAELLVLDEVKLDALIQEKIDNAIKYYAESGFKNNEKIRISKIIHQFIETDKKREVFTVLSTEESVGVDIAGLKFTTRLDRLDEIKGGDKVIFDYKIGKPSVSNWKGEAIKEPQLPIYAVTNDTQGIAFIQLNADKVSTKGIFRGEETSEWNAQIDHWQEILESASNNFQNGIATVLPNKTACDYCDFDALCRIAK